MATWSELHGPDVEAQLREEADDFRLGFDHVWHRLSDFKHQVQQELTRFDTGRQTANGGRLLADGLRRLLVEMGERPHIMSPAELRVKHLRRHAEIEALEDAR